MYIFLSVIVICLVCIFIIPKYLDIQIKELQLRRERLILEMDQMLRDYELQLKINTPVDLNEQVRKDLDDIKAQISALSLNAGYRR